MKIITMCGSLKFQKEMMEMAEKLELEGNAVITPIYPTNENKDAYTEKEVEILDKMHKEKIKISDAIYVVNVGGYIGSSTQSEIAYATEHGKTIRYLESEM